MNRDNGKAKDMLNACRPLGRFFCLLMAMAAWVPWLAYGQATGPAMTQVVDTVYRADGTTATGTVLISWPAFTTADGKAVAAGSTSVKLGSGGAFTAGLAPNTGAQPAGVYYKVVYQLVGDTVQPAWVGEYRIVSDCLPANDVSPGDAVTVAAPSRQANFAAIVREVDVQVTSAAYDRSQYTIKFANDAAELLSNKFAKATLPDPLPPAVTTSGPSSSLYIAGGGFEVRRSDGGWGPTDDGNLVGRYNTQTIVVPRPSRVQDYLLRQYDGSSPAKYSRQSALVHVDYPL